MTREYLDVPYEERKAASERGAWWDKKAKAWYIGPRGTRETLKRWLVVPGQTSRSNVDPVEAFTQALMDMGCLVTEEHPIMDGQPHRIATEGDKGKETAGFYIAHLDGLPAGFIRNHRSGEERKWRASGTDSINPARLAHLRETVARQQRERDAEIEKTKHAVARRTARQLASLQPATAPTPYMRAKGIDPQIGAFVDAKGETTIIPLFDVEGKQWSMQYIQADGAKRFPKGGRKQGCFHPVGTAAAVDDAPALVITEGYATAVTAYQALQCPVITALDSGNLLPVATALQKQYPDKPIIFLGDDDAHRVEQLGINPGRVAAEKAADATGGIAIFPRFAAEDAAGVADGSLTDFNDLATQSRLGAAGIQTQLVNAVRQHLAEVSPSTSPTILDGMVKVGHTFEYRAGNGAATASRHIQWIDHRETSRVDQVDALARVMVRAMNARPLLATHPLALVQLSNGVAGQRTPGVVVIRRKDETAEEAVERAMRSDPVMKLVQQALRDPAAVGFHARVMPGQLFFIGPPLQQSLADNGVEPVALDANGRPGWRPAQLAIAPYDPARPALGHCVTNIAPVGGKNVLGLTPDEIVTASEARSDTLAFDEANSARKAAGAYGRDRGITVPGPGFL